MNLTVNSFFCGAGGFDLGFINAGFKIVGAWDFDEHAVKSYRHNIGNHVKLMDVSKMTGYDLPYASVYLFGFPCQDVSLSGKKAGLIEGKRSSMFFEIMRLLGEVEKKPEIILAENVKGVSKFIPVIEEEYKKAGYRLVAKLYNSKFWGVPQNRERYMLLGIREDLNINIQLPEEDKTNVPRLYTILEDQVDISYYYQDVSAIQVIEPSEEGLKVRQATKKGYDIAVAGDSINYMHPNSKTRRGRVGKQVAQTLQTSHTQVVAIPEIVVAADLNRYRNDQMNRIYGIEGVAPTALTVSGGGKEIKILEQTNPRLVVRKLTPREYARLQAFPDSYEIVTSKTQAYKQFGNAVTVSLAEAIAKAIKEGIKNTQ